MTVNAMVLEDILNQLDETLMIFIIMITRTIYLRIPLFYCKFIAAQGACYRCISVRITTQ
jgi:hypothetical protein